MESNIKYRIATADDYQAILILYNDFYNSKRSISDLKWLYDDNPMGLGVLFIALIEDRVIGMQGIVRYAFWKDNLEIHTYKSEDSLIHANFRGKGIYKTLYKMVFEKVGDQLIWGLTDKRTILEKTGLPSSHRFVLTAAINGFISPSFFKGERKIWAKTILYNSLNLRSLLSRNNTNKISSFKTETLTNFNGIKTFIRVLSSQNPSVMFPVLTEDSIQWRLQQNPKVKKWKVFAMRDVNEKIKALTLITIDGKKGRWLSSYFDSTLDKETKKQHINSVKNQLFSTEVKLIDQWIFDTNPLSQQVKHTMLSSGFYFIKNGLWIVNNSHKVEISVDDILFSGQLGLD